MPRWACSPWRATASAMAWSASSRSYRLRAHSSAAARALLSAVLRRDIRGIRVQSVGHEAGLMGGDPMHAFRVALSPRLGKRAEPTHTDPHRRGAIADVTERVSYARSPSEQNPITNAAG